jgi:hypothetical protein
LAIGAKSGGAIILGAFFLGANFLFVFPALKCSYGKPQKIAEFGKFI